MTPQALQALRESIAHWRRAVESSDEPLRGENCALCQLFYHVTDEDGMHCTGCPVRERTGEDECSGSPWWAAFAARVRFRSGTESDSKRRGAVQAELDFLISLLPEGVGDGS